MCGRLIVLEDPIVPWVTQKFGMPLTIKSNQDLRPSQSLAAIVVEAGRLTSNVATWGIKPSWAKRLIINAQSETVATKKTFESAFVNSRCLVPCMGWYEWKDEGGERKRKYQFFQTNHEPVLMGALLFTFEGQFNIVTLTTSANSVCASIHHRMPVLIEPEKAETWLVTDDVHALQTMMLSVDSDRVSYR